MLQARAGMDPTLDVRCLVALVCLRSPAASEGHLHPGGFLSRLPTIASPCPAGFWDGGSQRPAGACQAGPAGPAASGGAIPGGSLGRSSACGGRRGGRGWLCCMAPSAGRGCGGAATAAATRAGPAASGRAATSAAAARCRASAAAWSLAVSRCGAGAAAPARRRRLCARPCRHAAARPPGPLLPLRDLLPALQAGCRWVGAGRELAERRWTVGGSTLPPRLTRELE